MRVKHRSIQLTMNSNVKITAGVVKSDVQNKEGKSQFMEHAAARIFSYSEGSDYKVITPQHGIKYEGPYV